MEHVDPMVMTWSRHRVHQPFGWWEAPGSSLQTTSSQLSVPYVPHGCALPWALWLHLRAMFPAPVTL